MNVLLEQIKTLENDIKELKEQQEQKPKGKFMEDVVNHEYDGDWDEFIQEIVHYTDRLTLNILFPERHKIGTHLLHYIVEMLIRLRSEFDCQEVDFRNK